MTNEAAAPRIPAVVKMRLPVETQQGVAMKMEEIDNEVAAHKNETFMQCMAPLILATKKNGQWNSPFEYGMMQEAMRRMDPPPSPVEVYNAFWKAYGDKYTSAAGIEWKNIASFIQEIREQCYTPPEEPQTKQEYLKQKVKRLKRENK